MELFKELSPKAGHPMSAKVGQPFGRDVITCLQAPAGQAGYKDP